MSPAIDAVKLLALVLALTPSCSSLQVVPVPSKGTKDDPAPAAPLASGKTSVLVLASGVRPSESWKEADSVTLGGNGRAYVAFGTLVVQRLDTSAKQLLVARNGDVSFFEAPADGTWPPSRSGLGKSISEWRAAGKLQTSVSLSLPDSNPVRIGYMVSLPASGPVHSSAQILLAVPGTEPLIIPIAMDIPQIESIFKNPVVISLMSAAVGGLIGLGSFLFQQWWARKKDAQKKFEERKVEKATELWTFFQKTYPRLVGDDQLTQLERVQNVRRTLLDDKIYPLLPVNVAQTVNRLSSQTADAPKLLDELRKSFQTSFREFME